MTGYSTLLEEALESWQFTREGVIAELKNIPEKRLDFRPAEESRTVIELVQHIIESGNLMAGELSRRDGDFQRKSYEGFSKEYAHGVSAIRAKRPLLDALKRTHAEGEKKIRAAGELGMLQWITRFDGKKGTRLAWMNHAISHEEYHRGQLALYARLMGRMPALTKLIRGA